MYEGLYSNHFVRLGIRALLPKVRVEKEIWLFKRKRAMSQDRVHLKVDGLHSSWAGNDLLKMFLNYSKLQRLPKFESLRYVQPWLLIVQGVRQWRSRTFRLFKTILWNYWTRHHMRRPRNQRNLKLSSIPLSFNYSIRLGHKIQGDLWDLSAGILPLRV